MGLIDTTSPMDWNKFKILTVLLCLGMLAGPFMSWFWIENEYPGWMGLQTDRDDINGYDDDHWAGGPMSNMIILATFIILMFVFLGYDITIDMEGESKRINELFPAVIAFMIFMLSASYAYKLNDELSDWNDETTTTGIGFGLLLIVICSLLIMVISVIWWRSRMDEDFFFQRESAPTPSQAPPPTRPAPVETKPATPPPVAAPEPKVEVVKPPEPQPAPTPVPAPVAASPTEAAEDEDLSKTAAFKTEVEKDTKLPPPPWITREEEK